MKKKLLLITATCLFESVAFAQLGIENKLSNIDWEEDSTEITTISDIFDAQQSIASVQSKQDHMSKVWSNRKFTNISYNSTKMDSKQNINLGSGPVKLNYKSNWGVAFTRGKNFLLHKKPIANILSFFFFYIGFDLGVNHYNYTEGRPFDLNASFTYIDNDNSKQGLYTPWDFNKYEVNYGMRLGPSITIAPFATLSNKMLNFLKINFYWHIGYNVSLFYIEKDETKNHYVTYDSKNDGVKPRFNLGHGVYNALGFNVSWKKIGLGFETRKGSYDYFPIVDDDFGTKDGLKQINNEYKFKTSTSRIFIQFRW